MAEQAGAAQITQRAEQGGVLAKLLVFTGALAIVPISAYFGTQWYFTPGNSIYPAISAVVAANIILFSYVLLAIKEDQAPKTTEEKKNQ